MSDLTALEERAPMPLVIAFGDLTDYTRIARRTDDSVLAEIVDDYYGVVTRRVEDAGGQLVKFIGDAFLCVFPVEGADRGVDALLALKDEVDAQMEARGWTSRLILKVHCGTVIAGPYGPSGRFDVLGSVVNTAARVQSRGVALTADAFRKLSKPMRRRFKKHTPPITYIGVEDRRPPR